MKELLLSVSKSADEELKRSYEKFPKFNSPHEGYAVIAEEVDEAAAVMFSVKAGLTQMWAAVKCNSANEIYANCIKEHAMNLAAEAIQVAAMAQKYIDSLGGETP